MDMSKGLYFLPLGGAAEIGMNLNLYCYEDRWLMVDLGVTFNDSLGLDIVMPNPQYIVERREQLDGLLLTHAHEDHIGAVPYLWQQLRCPIYATPFTAGLLRYKLEEAGIIDEVELIEIPLQGQRKIGPFEIQMIRLTHSIPEPNGVLITTPSGSIFHTGDWKLDPDPMVGEKTDEETLKKIGDQGVLAMVCDSTNVFQQEASGSEKDVFDNLLLTFNKYPDSCIAVTCFASNVARLQSVALAAQECGRKVVIAGRSFKRMEEVSRQNGYMQDVHPFISPEEAAVLPRSKVLYLCTGSQGEPRSVLKRIAEGKYHGIHLEPGDAVIFSSRQIPGNEKKIGALNNLLLRQGLHIVTQRQADIHVSGHPGREELEQMYAWVRPKIAIPVHGELRHLLEHGKLARQCGVEDVIIVDNGSLVRIAPGPAEIVEEVPAGRLALDGNAVVRLDHSAIKDREKLASNGVVFIGLQFDAALDLKNPLLIDMKGLVNVDNVLSAIEQTVEACVDDMDPDDKADVKMVKEMVTRAVRRTVMHHMKKKPLVMVHIAT